MNDVYVVNSRCWLEINSEMVLGEGRLMLLKKIDELGSLTKAAKSMGMSYRKAWGLVTEMNILCHQKLVILKTGGEKGGGAILSDFGRKLMTQFDELMYDKENFFREQSLKFQG
jgi:molybdate transport system regulatory protein